MRYEIEITSPDCSANRVVSDADLVPNVLEEFPDWYFCLVAAVTDRVDYGNFIVLRTEELAWVRLDEHCEHIATTRIGKRTASVTFKDSDGSDFVVPGQEVVPLSDALRSLRYWLESGKKDPGLEWS